MTTSVPTKDTSWISYYETAFQGNLGFIKMPDDSIHIVRKDRLADQAKPVDGK